ncbi:hypothetical protein PN465_15705 [Nodularia spumigena CS-584]|nr:hypothetical protein [Nodularia spumigena]MDB9383650.1 hypothetical protein [Nodularia spumigena CS-584]
MVYIDLKQVKVEHLVFLNKTWKGMQKSQLHQYCSQHEPNMLENIRKDKKANGYKITSRRMFAAEVAIMTDVIKHLNQKGIEVLYVFGALICEEKDRRIVIETMSRLLLEYRVKTSVKANMATALVKI